VLFRDGEKEEDLSGGFEMRGPIDDPSEITIG
jgi:hypothetical protein